MRAWWGKGMRIEGCSALDFFNFKLNFKLNFKRAGSAVRSTPKRARGNSRQRSVVSEEARADVVVVLCVVVCVCCVCCVALYCLRDNEDKKAAGKV